MRNQNYVITGVSFVPGIGMMPNIKPMMKASAHQLETCDRIIVRNNEVVKTITQEDLKRLDIQIARGGQEWRK